MYWTPEDANEQGQDDMEVTHDANLQPDDGSGSAPQADSMQDALDQVMPTQVEVGEIIKGIVAAVDNQWVSVDIGSKDEGLVPISEFAASGELPKVDDEIEVAVVRIDEEKGQVRLSKRRADYERVWNTLAEAVDSEQIVEALVTERVKGGLRVDVGVPGFVPGSHVASRNLRNLERFVGQSLRLRVLEADRRSKKVILSHRLVVEQEREQRRQETLSRLQEGVECEGKVRNLTNYGAFVDLGGVDGLLHVSEMAWTRIKHPSEVMSVGDTVRVVVLEVDPETDRISLSRRQILPDPWKEISRKLHVGDLVKVRISRVVRTGAFAQLPEHDIEGFMPIGEMSSKRIAEASEVVRAGQELELKITEMRPSARRMTLSLIAAEQEKERQEYREYMAGQKSARVTLGDQFGDILQRATVVAEPAEPAVTQQQAPATEETLADESGEPDASSAPEAADADEQVAHAAQEEDTESSATEDSEDNPEN
jgi:small subunit ribosomal protein S1